MNGRWCGCLSSRLPQSDGRGGIPEIFESGAESAPFAPRAEYFSIAQSISCFLQEKQEISSSQLTATDNHHQATALLRGPCSISRLGRIEKPDANHNRT